MDVKKAAPWIERILWLAVITVVAGTMFLVGRNVMLRRPYRMVSAEVIHIYMAVSTLPTLYANLHFLSHNNPSYMYLGRAGTFNFDMTPDHVQPFMLPGSGTPQEVAESTRQLIANLEDYNNGESKFHFYIQDAMVLIAFYALLGNEIPEDRFHITMFTSGEAWYSDSTANLAGSNGLSEFQTIQQELEDFKERVTTDTITLEDYTKMWINRRHGYAAALLPNVEHWSPFPEYKFMADHFEQELKSTLLRGTFTRRSAQDLLNRLNPEMREVFFAATIGSPDFTVGTQQIRTFLENYRDKPVMIITGTGHATHLEHDFYDTILDQLVYEFGDYYTLMFKPHPVEMPTGDRRIPFDSRGIYILPAILPIEIVMWEFPEFKIGGFSSSLFMSMTAEQVRFFIGRVGWGYPWGGTLQFLWDNGFFAYVGNNRFGNF